MIEGIQEKADAINAFGRAAKLRNLDELVSMFINNREFQDSIYLEAFRKVLTKYKLTDKFDILLEEFDRIDTIEEIETLHTIKITDGH